MQDGVVDAGGLVLVELLLVVVPELDHLALGFEVDDLLPVVVADGAAVGAFVAEGLFDEFFAIAVGDDAFAQLGLRDHFAPGHVAGALEVGGLRGKVDVLPGLEGDEFGAVLEEVGIFVGAGAGVA